MVDERKIDISIEDGKIRLEANFDADAMLGLSKIPSYSNPWAFGETYVYLFSYANVPALSLRYGLVTAVKKNVQISFADGVRTRLTEIADKDKITPTADLGMVRGREVASVVIPRIPMYVDLMRELQASPQADGSWNVPVGRIRDLVTYNDDMLPSYAKLKIGDRLRAMVSQPLPKPYDGSAESLREIPLSALHTVTGQSQSWTALSKNNASIEEKFHSLGVDNLYDLLMLAPDRYIDRSEPQPIFDLIEGETAIVVGKITDLKTPSQKVFVIVMEDDYGDTIELSFFNQARWLKNKYRVGDSIIATGVYKPWHAPNGYYSKPQIAQPQIDMVASAGALPVMPVYDRGRKVGLTSGVIMHCEQELVSRLGDKFRGPRWACEILEKNSLDAVPYGDALKTMHLPKDTKAMDRAKSALAFIELVDLMMVIENEKRDIVEKKGIAQKSDGALLEAYKKCLPYDLTGAQKRVVGEITKQMESSGRLHALLVGDVGSGKTTVMHLAALKSVDAGHQAVVFAPTEILAHQLYDVFMKIYEKMPEDARERIHPVYHAGYKGKGSTHRRNENVKAIKNGEANLIFGTQSVLNVKYHDLGFFGVDEQHKFGAKQRSTLLEIRDDDKTPDLLMQTATPIPRSMAQVYYGDLTFLELDELPAGRQPITTEWVRLRGSDLLKDRTSKVWADVVLESRKGHGTFVVCPMVEDSPKLAASSVKKTLEQLKSMLPGVKIEAVYGSQKKDEQDAIIEKFKNSEIDVLVASSVVEVGVSCEKATRMVILDANRFGIASLHQIRGRVGRSDLKSVCYLVASPFASTASRRMEAMTKTLDGWELSKTDLANRGAGSLFGTAQSGKSDLHYASLGEHSSMIEPAREEANVLLESKDRDVLVADAIKYFGSSELLA